jgi:crotonobetainyl-CoA:carnitine CoA-transferase CaiB-like acyl-CoA transferase
MAYQVGKPDGPPMIFVSGYADTTGGIVLAQGILAALVARERNQVAQKIEVSLLGSMVAGLEKLPVNCKAQEGEEMPRKDRTKIGNPLWNYYKCGDGEWIALGMLVADKYWSSFWKALGIEELEHDSRFSDIEVRSQPRNSETLIRILDPIFATKPRKEWIKILREHKLICMPIQTISDLLSEPQVLENEYIIDYEHPVFGRIKTVGFPWSFSKTPASLRLPAPQLDSILRKSSLSWAILGVILAT